MSWEALKQQASAAVHQTMGEPLRYQYKEGTLVELCGVFTMVDVQVDTGGETFIDSRKLAVSLRRCDMQRKPRQGDRVMRRDVVYEIQQCEENHDTGWRCLLLALDARASAAVRSHT
jgi:hypothetical protein